ncbi:MAG TPA: biotin carboxyl carrier protein [Candidatus Binatia bacterium]|nr:biotin carboxyl carrier protein [Candidatus Binatia bacterium]
MDEIRIVDTTLRDGNTSLWAHNMTTGMMHPVLRHMDQAGFDGMEFFVSGRFKKVVREQRDNPWDWVRYGQKEVKNTRLRYHGGLSSGFSLTPPCMPRLIIQRVVHYGITLTRLSDPWNDYDELKKEVAELKTLGMESVVNIIYSISPRHTDEYYARKAREAAAMRPYRLCFKDVGGMLTPDRAKTLARIILDNAGEVPVEFHAHCNNGLAPFNLLEVVKEGIRIVHTSIPPLANGSAQPSIFNVVNNLRALGYRPLVDGKVLPPVERHFRRVAQEEGLPIGAPREFDQNWYRHQVPGGMISNLRHQLKMLGKEDRMEAVLEEIVRVRAELGYPIMVTPFAQFVGSQAAINVMTGERYKEVTDQIIQYALGLWGKEGALSMDPEVKAQVLDRPRARELEKFEIPNPSLEEVRRQYGGPHLSDEELLLRFYAGPEFVDALKNAPPRKEYLDAKKPLVKLVEELTNRRGPLHVYIRRNTFTLSAGRRS